VIISGLIQESRSNNGWKEIGRRRFNPRIGIETEEKESVILVGWKSKRREDEVEEREREGAIKPKKKKRKKK